MATLFTYFCDTMSINKPDSVHREKETDMFDALVEMFRRYSVYRSTYNELSRMTNEELRDIGLDRSIIEEVARDSAYGRRLSH